jgi:hypothetical protein
VVCVVSVIGSNFSSICGKRDAHDIEQGDLLLQQRIIRCGGAVDDDMANLIVAQLLYLDAADPNRVCFKDHLLVDFCFIFGALGRAI